MLTTPEIIAHCHAALETHYGPRFQGLVLYGSEARGDADTESDIDLLVLLTPPVNVVAELWDIVEVLYPIQLESARLISAKPAPLDAYQRGDLALYRNAAREGVAV